MFTVISGVLRIRLLSLLSSARLTRLLDLADKCLDIAVCQWPSVHGRSRLSLVDRLPRLFSRTSWDLRCQQMRWSFIYAAMILELMLSCLTMLVLDLCGGLAKGLDMG